jgi:CPA2 family monovalent cation:H+ antiporter-2
LLAGGEFALIVTAFALEAGLDHRLASFAADYVLMLAVVGPLLASRTGLLVAPTACPAATDA